MEIGGQRNYTCTIHSTLLERGERYICKGGQYIVLYIETMGENGK
jgi:hypothetical protein